MNLTLRIHMFCVDTNCDAVIMDGVNLSSHRCCTVPSGDQAHYKRPLGNNFAMKHSLKA